MSGQVPGSTGWPPKKEGLSGCAIAALVIVALILLVFGVCVVALAARRGLGMPAPVSEGMPVRNYRLHRYVSAFCPHCHAEDPTAPLDSVARLSGYLVEEEGHIWLVRACQRHGRVVTLYDESPEILRYLEEWTAPTKAHIPDRPGNFAPIPHGYLGGLPEMQTQHTCVLLEDVIQGCNLRCPTCFADSSPDQVGIVPVADVLANVDARLSRENGKLDVIMVSGGEPTIHPEITTVLSELVSRPINRILLNTNGLRIARDDALLGWLAEHRDRVEVYLQYDGRRASSYRAHRGGDLVRWKESAVDRLSEAGVFTTLTMTAALGVNDDEIGAVVRRSIETPYIAGVSIQPMFGSGRSAEFDPMDRLTHTGVLARLGPQTDGLVDWHDLTALPCSHPHCCSVGYLVRTDSGEWRSIVRHHRPRPDEGAPRPDEQPHRGLAACAASARARPAVPARAAVERGVPGSAEGVGAASGCVPELRPRHDDAGSAGGGGPHGPEPQDPPDDGRAHQAHHGQAVHGRQHDDRGAADAVLRPRRHSRRR